MPCQHGLHNRCLQTCIYLARLSMTFRSPYTSLYKQSHRATPLHSSSKSIRTRLIAVIDRGRPTAQSSCPAYGRTPLSCLPFLQQLSLSLSFAVYLSGVTIAYVSYHRTYSHSQYLVNFAGLYCYYLHHRRLPPSENR